jgi:hypothetical protein
MMELGNSRDHRAGRRRRPAGGPHALACGALLPERMTKVAVLVGIAPREAEGLDWLDGMASSNVAEYAAVAHGYEQIATVTRGRTGPPLDMIW